METDVPVAPVDDPLPIEGKKKRKRHRGFKRELGSRIEHKFCYSCGYSAYNGLTVDHIVPLASGGQKRAIQNLCFLCRSCNSHKGDLCPLKWFQNLYEGLYPTKPNPELRKLLLGAIKRAVKLQETLEEERRQKHA